MPKERSTFESLARHLIGAAAPLIKAGVSLGEYKRLMVRLGFSATSTADLKLPGGMETILNETPEPGTCCS